MKKLIFLIPLFVAHTSCSDQSSTGSITQVTDSVNSGSEVVADTLKPSNIIGIDQFKFDLLLMNLHSPLEVLNNLNKTKAEYNSEYLTPNVEYKGASVNNQMQAFYFGIYTVDMAYCFDYSKNSEAVGYLPSIKKLSEDLGISKYYDKLFYEKFSSNISKKDSLMVLINDAAILTDKYCRDNSKLKISLLIFSGSWFESISIASKTALISEQNEANKSVYNFLWEQRLTVTNFLQAIEGYKKENYFKDIYPVLSQIKDLLLKAEKVTDLKQEQVKVLAEKCTFLKKKLCVN